MMFREWESKDYNAEGIDKNIESFFRLYGLKCGVILQYNGVSYEVCKNTGFYVNPDDITDENIKILEDSGIIEKRPRSMTLSEIEKALGYGVEIVPDSTIHAKETITNLKKLSFGDKYLLDLGNKFIFAGVIYEVVEDTPFAFCPAYNIVQSYLDILVDAGIIKKSRRRMTISEISKEIGFKVLLTGQTEGGE